MPFTAQTELAPTPVEAQPLLLFPLFSGRLGGQMAHNVLGIYDVWRSGKAGLAQRLRLSANAVTKPNVGVAPEGAQRLEHKHAVRRRHIGAPFSRLLKQGVGKRTKKTSGVDFGCCFLWRRFKHWEALSGALLMLSCSEVNKPLIPHRSTIFINDLEQVWITHLAPPFKSK